MMRHITAGWLVYMLYCATAWAHPFHTSLTELEYNQSEQKLEMAIKLTIVDVEAELSAANGRNIVMDGDPENDALIFAYIRSRLWINSAQTETDKPLTLVWVGKQLDIHHMWVYMTAEPPPEPSIVLHNRLLLDNATEQINTVVVLKQGKRQAHQLNAEQTQLVLRFDDLSESL